MKLENAPGIARAIESPSPRRAWIEINEIGYFRHKVIVALPSEGVD